MTKNAERIERLRDRSTWPSNGWRAIEDADLAALLAEYDDQRRKIDAALAEVNEIDAMVAEHPVTVEVSIAFRLVSRGLRAALTTTTNPEGENP